MEGVNLRDVLRWSLTATADFSADSGFPVISDISIQKAGKSLSKLKEGVLFSRRFILTYPTVLLGIILVFTVIHWGGKGRRAWRRRRNSKDASAEHDRLARTKKLQIKACDTETSPSEEGDSASSTTLSGTGTPVEDRKCYDSRNETSPLLPGPKRPLYLEGSATAPIRAFFMYQPRPLPIVNKALPSNGTSLVILSFIGLNIFYIFNRITLSIPLMFVFADRTALVFVANLPVLYLLAAKNQPIKLLTGYSYENLNIIHRRLGELLCLLALFHAVGMTIVWYTLLRPTGFTLARFLLSKIIILGLGALTAYELLYVTSLGTFRQRWYETFLFMHVTLQVAALAFLYFHHLGSRPYVLAALTIFVIDRCIFRLMFKTQNRRATLAVLPDQSTVLVSANWQIQPRSRYFIVRILQELTSNVGKGWYPTAHVFLTVPSLSRKHFLQAHPFSIASAAPDESSTTPSAGTHAWFSLLIRAKDGFSADLLRYAQRHSTAMIRIDGPYGSRHALEMLEDANVAIVVAGGSGIAVAYSLLWSLLAHSKEEEMETGKQKKKIVSLIWSVHERSHVSWIGEERLKELREKGCWVCISEPTSVAGRLDVRNIIKSTVEASFPGWGKADWRIGVVCSGPDSMNRDVQNTCAGLVKNSWDVGVAVEKYGW